MYTNKLLPIGFMVLCISIYGCFSSVESSQKPQEGTWRFILNLGEAELPFDMQLSAGDTAWNAIVVNAEEQLTIDEIQLAADSIRIQMPVFNSIFKGELISPTQIEGTYQDFSRGLDYEIPFRAIYEDAERFQFPSTEDPQDFSGRWKVIFSPGSEEEYPAIGIFDQEDNQITGTFLTETGDYRYLDGNVNGEQMRVSAFDGSHAYLFKARMTGDTLRGVYYSGIHFKTDWYAVRDDQFQLKDPYELTYLKAGYESLSFTFPDTDSNMVSLDDPKYQDKVLIVQMMGTWCPNCMDESRFFAQLYDQYQSQGLEIIALAYERQPGFEDAVTNIQRLRDRFEIDYDILIAGTSDKLEAAETLPMLNTVISFPTAIFIDKHGEIRKIHTGFYGPGTGDYYSRFVDETTNFIEKLLNEAS